MLQLHSVSIPLLETLLLRHMPDNQPQCLLCSNSQDTLLKKFAMSLLLTLYCRCSYAKAGIAPPSDKELAGLSRRFTYPYTSRHRRDL